MKMKLLRCGAVCLMIVMLCAGVAFQYMNADKNQRTGAVLVMATSKR